MARVFHGIYVKICKPEILVMCIKQKGVIFMKDKIKVKFKDINDVSKFVRIVSQYDGDFDLYCGSYCVDAKSILGIMTMDLKSILWMTSNCEQSDKERLMRELKPVIAA